MTAREWLLDLTALRAASGLERSVHDYLRAHLEPFSDRLTTDGAGNLVAWRDGPEESPLVLVAAHADQVAMRVRAVLPGGYLRVSAPSIDLRCLQGLTVEAAGQPGVVGMLPPHLRRGGEPDKPLEESDVYVDMGGAAPPPVGTPVYFRVAPRALGQDRLSAPALDNRASVAAACLLLEALREREPKVRLACAFTAGEEKGRGGAAFLGLAEQADLALAVDVTFARQPEVAHPDHLMELGGGPAIGVGPNVPMPVLSLLRRCAEAAGVHWQSEPLPGDSGTDGWALQVAGLGLPTGVVSIPLRSMHSPAEVVAPSDVEATTALLAQLATAGFAREDLAWD